jgi:hypothetical protein
MDMNGPPDPVGHIEEELRAIHRQRLAQGTAALDFIEARHRGDVPPYFLCPRCGLVELDEYVDVPGEDPVLIDCARCSKRFKADPWDPDGVELAEDDWFPERILLGHCVTKSEVHRAIEERDRARLEAELEANPLDEEEEDS